MKTGLPRDLLRIGLMIVVGVAGIASAADKTGARVAPLTLELGPYVRYVTPTSAEVHWRTRQACPSVVEYGRAGPGAKHSPSIELSLQHQGENKRRLTDLRPKKLHVMTLTGLLPHEVYAYRVGSDAQGQGWLTPVYELDTALNYAVPPLQTEGTPFANDTLNPQVQALARQILAMTGLSKGYCLVWGIVDGQLAYELARNSQLIVVGVDADRDRVSRVRNILYQAGVYGERITLHHVSSWADVPFPSHFANLIVSERAFANEGCPGDARDMVRLLQPKYGTAVLSRRTQGVDRIGSWLEAASLDFRKEQDAKFVHYRFTKPPLPGTGSWTHQYGDAGNSANSHESLNGVSATGELQVQWLGHPGADFGIDRNPRMPAPLAVSGKLFHQGMNRMVAIDSYNGAILWSLEIPDLRRVNLPRDASNWCADSSSLYVAVKDRCWVLDHDHGDLRHVFAVPPGQTGEAYDWGYVARAGEVLLGSQVKPGMAYTGFWGKLTWYDKARGAGAGKVCSDGLFGYDVASKSLLWKYQRGVIINTTIAAQENRCYFIESRNSALSRQKDRRLNDPDLWADQFLVSLDTQTGAIQWEVPIDTADGTIVFFLSCTDRTIVVASSAEGKYHLYGFECATGKMAWQQSHKWTSDNHSGHMQHPVLFDKRVYLEPCGYDLLSGELLTSSVGRHEGCATYCGVGNALLYRGESRRISLWDMEEDKVSSWYNLRPSCWLSAIAADGMVLLPEGGGGCSCGNWLETSLALLPVNSVGPAQQGQ